MSKTTAKVGSFQRRASQNVALDPDIKLLIEMSWKVSIHAFIKIVIFLL